MRLLIAVLFLGTAGLSDADDILLTSGRKVMRARVIEQRRKTVVVEIGIGTLRLQKSDVVAIESKRTPLHDYGEKLAEVVRRPSADEYYRLAVWARENGLYRYVRPNLDRALELEPTHEEVHRTLDHEKISDRWMTREEANQARGLIFYEGLWLTPTDVEARKLAKAQAEREKAERRLSRDLRKPLPPTSKVRNSASGSFYRPSEFWPYYYRPDRYRAYYRHSYGTPTACGSGLVLTLDLASRLLPPVPPLTPR